MLASFPGPCPASRRLQYGKAGEGLVHFLTWVMSRIGQIMRMWVSCKPQKTSPTRTHWSTTIPSLKMAVHEGTFMSLFARQSGGQRILPSQDSEDTQQQFSRAHPHSIKVFLPSFYPWRHSREKMYQALSHFTVLQATGSWARAWKWGYKNALMVKTCSWFTVCTCSNLYGGRRVARIHTKLGTYPTQHTI